MGIQCPFSWDSTWPFGPPRRCPGWPFGPLRWCPCGGGGGCHVPAEGPIQDRQCITKKLGVSLMGSRATGPSPK
eukprot:2140622-Karenia_brevis.AAC.1